MLVFKSTKNKKNMIKRKYTFTRWFAHWCAFQLTALNLKCWRPSMLFHDIDKPILNLVLSNDKVKKFHNNYSSHHLNSRNLSIDDAIIDWQCSHLTKPDAQLLAKDTLVKYYSNIDSTLFNRISSRIDDLGI